ncbi:MAG: sugar phosphate isomerase/epimerase [Lentisphaerae bacterium]|nr:sugar phosphate isomerase/epimerase [Lentisphaerota bacterium]MBT4818566.1 sugar phosphate isomerase/epimerase [Lentisphaerota bacterium]MBT5610771.1 sugar phosphate isomerase/epimerase [Lentisphaerota bacterium]MBT7060853.1 sugar phosphate isomerase/epimerase [Lentisphaerota bacterium]MBT7841258.1 sugar phosphate isomerase/epimerase [Lentisphaerota bacterium]
MAKPISVQLYSLREEAKTDFPGVLRRVAEIGYKGVEPAGFNGLSPQEFKTIVSDLGMVVSSSHGPAATKDSLNEVIEAAGILEMDLVCRGFGPDAFKDLDVIKRTADEINELIPPLKAAGLNLFMHNHYWEFAPVGDRLAYDHFAEMCPDVLFELDTYWSSNFGANDPAEQVAKFRDRIPLLHIKDGPLVKGEPMVAAGAGKMDFPSVLAAANPDVLRWVIVELDACATDMFTAVEESYNYLVESGLGEGNA